MILKRNVGSQIKQMILMNDKLYKLHIAITWCCASILVYCEERFLFYFAFVFVLLIATNVAFSLACQLLIVHSGFLELLFNTILQTTVLSLVAYSLEVYCSVLAIVLFPEVNFRVVVIVNSLLICCFRL